MKKNKKQKRLTIQKETLRTLQGAADPPPKVDHSYAIICGGVQLAESGWCLPVDKLMTHDHVERK